MGWLDGLDVELVLESDDCLRFPGDPYLKAYNEYGEVNVFKHDGVIRGHVRLKASTKLPVYVSAVTIAFEQFSTYNKSIDGHQLAFREWTVSDSENLKVDEAGASLPFEIDLASVYPRDGLRPTYAGTLYYIRHEVFASAKKPWYSFGGSAVQARQPVHLLKVGGAPGESVGAEAGAPAPHVLALPDVGGGAVFDFGRNCFDLEATLEGAVAFAGLSAESAVAFVKLELVKVEVAELISADTAVWTNVLYPPKAKLSESGWLKNKVAKSDDEDGDDFVDLVEPGRMGGDVFVPPAVGGEPCLAADATLQVRLDFATLEPASDGRGRALTPSYRKLPLENVPDIATDAAEPRSPTSKGAACSPDGGGALDGARFFPTDEDDWEPDLNCPEGVAETAYYLKLTAITDKGKRAWNTKKIYLYKSSFDVLQKTIDIDI